MSKNQDFEFFGHKLSEFLNEHSGEFLLIKDKSVFGFFKTLEETLNNAYKKFGDVDFLIQEITDERRINYINSEFLARVA